MSITHLEPQNIWKNFAALNAVPRPSKKEERVIAGQSQYVMSMHSVTSREA